MIYAMMYSEYPIYEPAEGGYYYAGRTAADLEDNEYETVEEAIEDIKKWVEELNADEFEDKQWICVNTDPKTAKEHMEHMAKEFGEEEGRALIAYQPSKYIGEGAQIYVETPAAYKKHESGWHPYE